MINSKKDKRLEKLLQKKKITKPLVKVINYNREYDISPRSRLFGIFSLWIVTLICSLSLTMCFITSFQLGVTLSSLLFPAVIISVIALIIYYSPSSVISVGITVLSLGACAWYVWANLEDVWYWIYYTINLCLYKISTNGYSIEAFMNIGLAQSPEPEANTYIYMTTLMLLAVTMVYFSFLIYSRKSVLPVLIFSLAAIFPGFFCGLMPSFSNFLSLIACWIAVLSMDIYDMSAVDSYVRHLNDTPAKKLRNQKIKQAEKEYNKKIKATKKEIRKIINSPNRDDNIFKLNRLAKELTELNPDSEKFLKRCGIKEKNVKTKKKSAVKEDDKPKEEFFTPAQLLKKQFKEEKIAAIQKEHEIEEIKKQHYAELSFKERTKEKFTDNFKRKAFISARSGLIGLSTMAIALFSIFISSLIIKEESTLRVNINEEAIEFLSDTVNYAVNGSNSGMYDSYGGGMSGGNLLSRGVSFKNKEVILLNTNFSGKLYLRGWYGNTYTGKKWLGHDAEERTEYSDKFGIDFNDVQLYASGYSAMLNYYRNKNDMLRFGVGSYKVNIEHYLTGGRVMFVPYYTSKDDITSGLKIKQNGNMLPTLSGSLFKYPSYSMSISNPEAMYADGESYNKFAEYVDYYENVILESFYNLEEIQSKLQNPNNINAAEYAELNEILNFILTNRNDILYESEQYSYALKNNTSGLPEEFPAEIVKLTEEIVKDANTDFEAAKAVEEYLSANFPYTLNPKYPMDPDADFIYNFLFDVKEGYCTYYATAMTVMLRTAGIPTRYVEGYLADCSKKSRVSNELVLYDYNAHAWCEVYIRGFGWIPFEPTAPLPVAEAEEKQYEYTPPVYSPSYNSGMMETPASEEIDEEEEAIETQNTVKDILKILPLVIIILAIIVVMLVNKVIDNNRMKMFISGESKAAVKKMLDYTFKLFRIKGYALLNGEGFINFSERLRDKAEFLSETEFQTIIGIFLKAKYSKHEISEQEREQAYQFVKQLRLNIKKQSTFSENLYYKYVNFVI